MNHDIKHCIGVSGDAVCKKCHRRDAHEDLLRLVRRGELPSGEIHSYVNAEACVKMEYKMLLEHE